jgi:hypothetical protein
MNIETTDETVAEWLSMAENLRAITAGITAEIEATIASTGAVRRMLPSGASAEAGGSG